MSGARRVILRMITVERVGSCNFFVHPPAANEIFGSLAHFLWTGIRLEKQYGSKY